MGAKLGNRNRFKTGRYTTKRGYVMVLRPVGYDSKRKYVEEHVLIVERAIGKRLPPEAEVHHVNEVKNENRNDNLLACADHRYHELIHHRMGILRLGGHPDTHNWCTGCRSTKPLSEFFRSRQRISGFSNRCKPCDSIRKKRRLKGGNQRKLFCSKGHPIVTLPSGGRVCRQCHAMREARRRLKVAGRDERKAYPNANPSLFGADKA